MNKKFQLLLTTTLTITDTSYITYSGKVVKYIDVLFVVSYNKSTENCTL